MGIEFLIWPAALQGSAFRFLPLPEIDLAFGVVLLGWSRCAALMLNGQKILGVKAGRYVRAGCGVVSAILWAQFTLALLQLSIAQNLPSPGLPFWFMFTIGELFGAYSTVKNG